MSGKGKGKQRALPSAIEVRDNGDAMGLSMEGDDYSDPEEEDHIDHSYESQRQRRILENQQLLTSLGISSSTTRISTAPPVRRNTSRSNVTPNKKRRAVYDRSGYIISHPQGDERHTLAAVEIPHDRGLKRRIQAGEYQDCSSWAAGEDRRWRFGLGRGGKVKDDEPSELGGVVASFRWRIWKGLERELRKEMKKRGELNEIDQRPVEPEPELVQASGSAYSLLPGEACHQCRRKSEKLKMRCRNVDPLCKASFCETCCKRYSYFDFDPESRSFICPLCKDCCNCSNCIRKRDLGHLLPAVGKGGRTKSLMHTVRAEGHEGMTVQAWIEKATEERVGIPFDRVRLVDHELDVITPYSPELDNPKPEPTPTKKKKQGGGKGTKRKRKQADEEDKDKDVVKPPLFLKFKMPPARPKERVKEVDSDGDTIGDWSNDASDDSDLTPLSDSLSPVPPRLAFPSRPSTSFWDNIRPAAAVVLPLASPTNVDPPLPPREVPRSSLSPPSDSNTEGGKKRRKPPPKANILRAPKHSISHQDPPVVPLPSLLHWQIPPSAPSQMWMDKQQETMYSDFSPLSMAFPHGTFQRPIDVSINPAQGHTVDLLREAARVTGGDARDGIMINGNGHGS